MSEVSGVSQKEQHKTRTARQQIEQILELIEKRKKVVYHGGKTATIDGKTFHINDVRAATQKKFVQRVIRRHKDAANANRTELPTGPSADTQAAGENQDSGERADQGSGD